MQKSCIPVWCSRIHLRRSIHKYDIESRSVSVHRSCQMEGYVMPKTHLGYIEKEGIDSLRTPCRRGTNCVDGLSLYSFAPL